MQVVTMASGFIEFVNKAVTPFHATRTAKEALLAAGFVELAEHEPWSVSPGHKYFFTRNLSSIHAFVVGHEVSWGTGAFRVIGTHTDSPCPKLAPVSYTEAHGMIKLNVQLYGGGLWHSWFDRDLTLAGRVVYLKDSELHSALVHIKRPIVNIPQLCIHLSSTRDKFEYNKEQHVKPLIASSLFDAREELGKSSQHSEGLLRLISGEIACVPADIKDLELCLVDCNPACLSGIYNEFISSPRIDNLLSTYCALQALIHSKTAGPDILYWAAFDNEEVGSSSIQGADSIVLECVLKRILKTLPLKPAHDSIQCFLRRSFIVSADMAHAVHPNYPEKHQADHRPKIHGGVVIKTNANQRYATDAVGASYIRTLGGKYGVPVQEFIVPNDSACGSTIGPMTAARTGCRTADIGAPQLAMHSCREFMGTEDTLHYYNLMHAFYNDSDSVFSEPFQG